MDETILNSVIEITNKKDTDSLELSITSALVEQVDCTHLVIYKKVNNGVDIRSNINLIVHSKKPKYEWLDPEIIQTTSPELQSCFDFSCAIHNELTNDKVESWHPIVIEQKSVAVVYIKSNKLNREQQVLLNGFCRIYENYLSILKESECDKLTGLLNRQTFEPKIRRFLELQTKSRTTEFIDNERRMKPSDLVSWLAIIDIDHFKKVNDQFGHVCGDEVLLIFSQLLKSHFRKVDLLFRFGGEEFIVVMEAINSKAAVNKLNLFRKEVAKHRFPFIDAITISAGITSLNPNVFTSSTVDRADKALYYAKNNGRNAVYCFEELIGQKMLQQHEPSINSSIELF